jgi:integrase
MTDTRPAKFPLTEARVKGLQPDADRRYYADSKTRGFQLAVYPSGVKSFLIYRWVHGRADRIFIGRWPDLTVEQARKIAERMNGEIAQGRDPGAEQRQKRLEGTLSNLFERYLELHARPHKQPSSVAEDEALYRRYLSRWATKPLSTITRRDVERLHAHVGEKHGRFAANRALALLTTMFSKAAHWGWNGPNPTAGVSKFSEKEHARERFLTAAEMPRFLKALSEDPDADFQHFILLALLTGARSGNLIALRWSELDLNEATWRIPRTKGGKPQLIPLVPPALRILARRREQANGDWVFPGRVPGEHREGFRKPWDRLLERAGLVDLRPHDLRRSLGSWLSKAGASMPTIKSAPLY